MTLGTGSPTVLDLFCGAAGGWSLGLHRAGFRTIAACEADPWRRAAFLTNFPHVRMYEDVRELTGDRLAADGVVPDIIVGSPPCQDASAANHKGRGVDGERTGLFFDALRLVREVRPRWCAFENSPRLRTRGVDRLLGELDATGYAAWPLVVGASDLGANHIRKRLVLIAADAEQVAVRLEPRRGGGTHRKSPSVALVHDAMPHAHGEGQHARASNAEAVAWCAEHAGAPSDASSLSRAEGRQGTEACAAGAQSFDRDGTGAVWGHAHWSAGAPDFGRVDDGLSDKVARACVSAYGDSFCPQIAEIVARAILAVEVMNLDRVA